MSDLQNRLAGIQAPESLIVITDGDARFEIERRTDTFFASIYEAVGLPFETGQVERTTQTLGMEGGDKLYPTNNFLTTLVIADVALAAVLDRRTELNYCEATFALFPLGRSSLQKLTYALHMYRLKKEY